MLQLQAAYDCWTLWSLTENAGTTIVSSCSICILIAVFVLVRQEAPGCRPTQLEFFLKEYHSVYSPVVQLGIPDLVNYDAGGDDKSKRRKGSSDTANI